jgi:hypothetical protein
MLSLLANFAPYSLPHRRPHHAAANYRCNRDRYQGKSPQLSFFALLLCTVLSAVRQINR